MSDAIRGLDSGLTSVRFRIFADRVERDRAVKQKGGPCFGTAASRGSARIAPASEEPMIARRTQRLVPAGERA